MKALIQVSLPSGFFVMAWMAVLRICYCQPPAELALQWQWCEPVLSDSEPELSPAYSLTLRLRSKFGTVSVRSVG